MIKHFKQVILVQTLEKMQFFAIFCNFGLSFVRLIRKGLKQLWDSGIEVFW